MLDELNQEDKRDSLHLVSANRGFYPFASQCRSGCSVGCRPSCVCVCVCTAVSRAPYFVVNRTLSCGGQWLHVTCYQQPPSNLSEFIPEVLPLGVYKT